MLDRPRLVVINKADIADKDLVAALKKELEKRSFEVFIISAATRKNVDALIAKTAEYISELPPLMEFETSDEDEISYDDKEENLFDITFDGDFFIVASEWAERLVRSTNFSDNESFFYFQRLIKRKGLDQALKDAGLENGDWVRIGDMEFQWFSEDEIEAREF